MSFTSWSIIYIALVHLRQACAVVPVVLPEQSCANIALPKDYYLIIIIIMHFFVVGTDSCLIQWFQKSGVSYDEAVQLEENFLRVHAPISILKTTDPSVLQFILQTTRPKAEKIKACISKIVWAMIAYYFQLSQVFCSHLSILR